MLVALLSSVTLMCGGGFDEKEIECEEAVARLQECCPNLDHQHIYCHVDGCNGATTPTLTLDDSMCILNQTCGSITSGNVCSRVENLAEFEMSNQGSTAADLPSNAHGVCP